MSDQFFWYATRAAGILTWFSATLSLCVGLMMSSRALGRRPTIPWLLDVHRYTAGMSMVFLFLHLFTLWADSFVDFTLSDFLIPGRADVPGLTNLSVAWGVVAAWILVVVEASSLVKKYLPPDWWHTIHLMSFGVVIAGLAHALQAGSDTDNRILVAVATSLLTAITLLLATRILRVLLDRKYQYDRALDAGSVEVQPLGRKPRVVDDVDVDAPLDAPPGPFARRAAARRERVEAEARAEARLEANAKTKAEVRPLAGDVADADDVPADLIDVDLGAYDYGSLSHLPPEKRPATVEDTNGGDAAGDGRRPQQPRPERHRPKSPRPRGETPRPGRPRESSPAERGPREGTPRGVAPPDGGPREGTPRDPRPGDPGGPDDGSGRSATSVIDEPARRWGGPGSFGSLLRPDRSGPGDRGTRRSEAAENEFADDELMDNGEASGGAGYWRENGDSPPPPVR